MPLRPLRVAHLGESLDPRNGAVGVPITIREALVEQVRINTSALRMREHITLHPTLMTLLGLKRLHQVRVEITGTNYYRVMTVEQMYEDAEGTSAARMHADAYAQFHLPVGTLEATLYTGDHAAVNNDLSDAEVATLGWHKEFLHDNGADAGLWCVAPHGGGIEYRTDDQATYVYDQLKLAGKQVSAWGTLGYSVAIPMTASNRWHTTAGDMWVDTYPLLTSPWSRTFSHGLGFHGYTGNNVIELGGLADPAVLTAVKAALEAAVPGMTVNYAVDDDIDGDNPRNIMNRLVPSGYTIQLEQSYDVRRDHWQDIADVMIAHFTGLL